MAPLHLASQRRERPHERPQKCRLALAVVADDSGPGSVHDLDVDRLRHLAIGITDAQSPAPHGRPLPRRHLGAADGSGRRIGGDLLHLELFKLLALRLRAGGGRGSRLVAGNKIFQLLPFREHSRVGPYEMLPLVSLVFEEGVNLPGENCQLAAGEVERAVAGGTEEGPVVRHDQAALAVVAEKVLEQDLRSQVEEVGRLVEQEQRGLMQEQGSEFDAGLPAAREFLDRAGEQRALEFEPAGHLAALPVGLAAVAHQEGEGGFAGLEGIVLPQIAKPQPGMPDDFAGVEFLLAEDHAEERAFSRAVASDEAHLAVVGDRGTGLVEEHLIAVALRGILDIEQHGHGRCPKEGPTQ